MGPDRQQVVLSSAFSRELLVELLVLRDDTPVLAQPDVAAPVGSTVVFTRDVGVESDETRQAARTAVRLPNDLLVVDSLEELPGKGDPRLSTPLLGLVEKRVRDQLQALLDQLIVDLSLALDLSVSLEPSGEPSLELSKPDVVKAGRVDVVSGDTTFGSAADLD